MARFYFHVIDGHVAIDRDGLELPSIEAARKEAVRAAGGILADTSALALAKTPWQMTVADHAGRTVYSLTFLAKEYI